MANPLSLISKKIHMLVSRATDAINIDIVIEYI
jgi:hypothetical protein